mmetsp:Transcript_26658/g.74614  ORF Transcript_26658/g.74614 Transcript_26658/m.74614 type:complete len:266 (-) Transcript_26658:307-1104(-)
MGAGSSRVGAAVHGGCVHHHHAAIDGVIIRKIHAAHRGCRREACGGGAALVTAATTEALADAAQDAAGGTAAGVAGTRRDGAVVIHPIPLGRAALLESVREPLAPRSPISASARAGTFPQQPLGLPHGVAGRLQTVPLVDQVLLLVLCGRSSPSPSSSAKFVTIFEVVLVVIIVEVVRAVANVPTWRFGRSMHGERLPLLPLAEQFHDASMGTNPRTPATQPVRLAVLIEFFAAEQLAVHLQEGNDRFLVHAVPCQGDRCHALMP